MSVRPLRAAAFTLVEILISILILALGVLGLGALFPVVIREQRIGSDAVSGVLVADAARAMLTQTQWGDGLADPSGQLHPVVRDYHTVNVATNQRLLYHPVTFAPLTPTEWLWTVLRNQQAFTATYPYTVRDGLGTGFNSNGGNTFQPYGQGEWFTKLVDPANGNAKIGYPDIAPALVSNAYVPYGEDNVFGCITLPVSQRLYPLAQGTPQFVWDFAVQRVTDYDHTHAPDSDPLRAVVFVRRIDPRIRPTGTAKTILDALTNASGTVSAGDRRLPLGEDANGNATLDGTDGAGGLLYSGVKTCPVEFWYDPNQPVLNHRDRLYMASGAALTPQLRVAWTQMKQPGQKLVDNLGNIYTVVGSGNEAGVSAQDIDGVAGADYIKIDPPVPDYVTKDRARPIAGETNSYSGSNRVNRAVWQVAFTPQIPVSVTLVDLLKGKPQ